ncbi:MAG TPA: hypothetical protein VK899_12800 [Gemmatimonadales bacterium]|nr:hypothetical protein [Gemmatimonadales bacterium]
MKLTLIQEDILARVYLYCATHGRMNVGTGDVPLPDLLADLGAPEREVWQVLAELHALRMIKGTESPEAKHPIIVLGVTRGGRRALRPWLRERSHEEQLRRGPGAAAATSAARRTTRITASLMVARDVHSRVIMETLGHSGISITADTYAHVLPQQQREAAEAVGRALQW